MLGVLNPMIRQLDSCQWLFLRELSEPDQNSLRLLIEEARSADVSEDVLIGNVTMQGLRKIDHDDSCRVFEVIWETYISYSVLNESYANAAKPGTYTGRRIRHYSASPFLEYVRTATLASATYPGPFQHISVLCESHIIEVASTVEPRVRLVKPGRPRPVVSGSNSQEDDPKKHS